MNKNLTNIFTYLLSVLFMVITFIFLKDYVDFNKQVASHRMYQHTCNHSCH